jgi:hypothetical protein
VSDRLPRPLLAAVGAITQVRRVPATLLTVPLVALTAFDRARRSYDALVLRGEQVLTERFGEDEPQLEPEPTLRAVTELEAETVLDVVSHVADPLDHGAAVPGEEPLPDYDTMTLGALRGVVRTLTEEQLQAVLAYERAHRHRPPVVTLVEHRLATLALP